MCIGIYILSKENSNIMSRKQKQIIKNQPLFTDQQTTSKYKSKTTQDHQKFKIATATTPTFNINFNPMKNKF